MTCVVEVEQGCLQGQACVAHNGKRFYSFEGIPYAKPPVGKLRFRDPQPPEKWTGVRDATKPGNKCAQMDPYGKMTLEGSEDCLYLNVYTPVLPAEKLEKLPVLFFVHGGRLLVGHGDYYRPDYFIQNDVILVTVNYRLHILGFLCLNIAEAPGNAGFKDTILALRWVRDNIKQFNGDESNVVAFGESAGGGLITSYLTCKMADGLVHKIISQSGICLSDLFMIDEDPIEKARAVVAVLGKDLKDETSLYDFLITAPLEDLIYAMAAVEVSRPPYIINAVFLPVVEKKFRGVERFLEEYQLQTFMDNRHRKIPVLAGLSAYEGALFLRRDHEGKIAYIDDLQRFIPRNLCIPYDSPRSKTIARNLQKYYFKNKKVGDETKFEYLNFVSDMYFNRDIIIFVELLSKFSDEVFFYHFCYHGNMNTRTMKSVGIKSASHGDIMMYQFYRKNKAEKCDENDRKIVNFLSEAWCNFAKHGKPSWSAQHTEWLPYRHDRRLCLNIDKDLTLQKYPYWDRIKFLLDTMGERSKL